MSKNSCLGIALIFALLAGGAAAQTAASAPQARCQALDASQREKLIRYVQSKYRLPLTMTLELKESSVSDSCYRQLEFNSLDSHKPFHGTFYASPDLRFLSRDLMDMTIDPAEEDRRLKRELITKLATGGEAPTLGPKDAPVTITLFSDFQCPYCVQAAKGLIGDTLPASNGMVKLEFRYFPLAMHAWARAASETAACARQQGDSYFWAFHDYFFEHQKELKPDSLRQSVVEYGAGLSGFKVDTFKACLDQKAGVSMVERDMALGRDIGVTATPTIFINGERVGGYQPDQIRTLIERGAPRKEQANRPLAK